MLLFCGSLFENLSEQLSFHLRERKTLLRIRKRSTLEIRSVTRSQVQYSTRSGLNNKTAEPAGQAAHVPVSNLSKLILINATAGRTLLQLY